MATGFPKTTVPGQNALTGVLVALTPCDATNGNAFTGTGSEVALVVNTNTTTAHTFTITGQLDPYGRTQNFSMSVPASPTLTSLSIIATPKLSEQLWNGANGQIVMPSSNNADLYVGVLSGL